jgi:hypothetical protein
MLSGKGWGTADVDGVMGGFGVVNVISENRCNLTEGLLKVRTIVSHIYSHIRSDLDQDQLDGDPKMMKQNMYDKIVTAFNQTYDTGDFVLLKHNKEAANPTVLISGNAGEAYTGRNFGYSVVAGGFIKRGVKGMWIGNTSRDSALKFSQDTFDQQYGEMTEASMLMHNQVHATIRESLIAETMMTAPEAWTRTMRLIFTCLTDRYTPRSLWSVTVDGDQIEVEISGAVRGVGQKGSLRIEEEHGGVWHFFWDGLLVVSLDTHDRSYSRPNTHPTAQITRLVQCPFGGVIPPGLGLMPFDWGVWPNQVSCTSTDGSSIFIMRPGDFKSRDAPLEIIATDPNGRIGGILYRASTAKQMDALVRGVEVLPSNRFYEARASVVYNACCSITPDPSSKTRCVTSLTQWIADSYTNTKIPVPEIPTETFVLLPLTRDEQWAKSSPPALLLRFGASSELPKSWCVGGGYGYEVDALEAAISWADATDEH